MILNSITDYYKYFDSIKFNSYELHTILADISKNMDNLSKNEKEKINIEIDCLNFIVQDGSFKPRYSLPNEKGELVVYPNLDNFTDESIQYLKDRVKTVKNTYLKARFEHFILEKTNDYKIVNSVIDTYFKLIGEFIELDKEKPEDYYGIEISYAIHNLKNLIFKYKIKTKIKDLQDLLLNILKNPNKESSAFLKNRIDSVEILIYGIEKKFFSKQVLENIENICIDTFNNSLNMNFAEAFYQAGIKLTKLQNKDSKFWIEKMAIYYENLMNNSADIIAPNYCQKAIELYEKLKNNKKVKELYKKYTFLSQNIKLHKYEVAKIDLTPYKEVVESYIKEHNSEEIIKYLIYAKELIPSFSQAKNEAEEVLKTNSLQNFVSLQILDEYGNKIKGNFSETERIKYEIYNNYNAHYDIYNVIILNFIKLAIMLKKINSNIILDYLENKTWYGIEFQNMTNSDEPYKYKWINYIQEAINTGFKKLEYEFLQEKSILYIPEIDSLTLKIEGILREIIDIAEKPNLRTFTFDKDDNYRWLDINSYLRNSELKNLILEDEVEFFKFLLTDSIGKNKRNRIAHSRCFLGEYSSIDFIWIILILLRLTKYKIPKGRT